MLYGGNEFLYLMENNNECKKWKDIQFKVFFNVLYSIFSLSWLFT